MLSTVVSNSSFGKRSGARRDMTIFGFQVGSRIPNSAYLDAYVGI